MGQLLAVLATFAYPVLPCRCVDALVPQCTHVGLLVAPVCVGVLQGLLCLLAGYLDAVLGPSPEALGNLPHTPPVQPHGCTGPAEIARLPATNAIAQM